MMPIADSLTLTQKQEISCAESAEMVEREEKGTSCNEGRSRKERKGCAGLAGHVEGFSGQAAFYGQNGAGLETAGFDKGLPAEAETDKDEESCQVAARLVEELHQDEAG